ncbi:hypothetical protein HYH02_011391 [Chlamydomonas schloesseri]|uniref:Uncharacterized protein n=1 Tax=Chlamydomonas schloesseri TaxID=2026947 RepID=A0A835TG30_9CHLO|nr:hypothetical protein HYH02_011391 [Chlamydomonas schloesseri]|eukprot:KAG2437135.1 hypothetical protein HYH02_011391 [Chlamydomonas schloesseri]
MTTYWVDSGYVPPPEDDSAQPVDGVAAVHERFSLGGGIKSRFANQSAPQNLAAQSSGASNFEQLSSGSTSHALDSAAVVVSASLALQQQQQQQQRQQQQLLQGASSVDKARVAMDFAQPALLLDVETGGTLTTTSGYGIGTMSPRPTTCGGRVSLVQEPQPQPHVALGVCGRCDCLVATLEVLGVSPRTVYQ